MSKAAAAVERAKQVDQEVKPAPQTQDVISSIGNPVLSLELATARDHLKQVGCFYGW
jgi:hypothetical protein